MPGLLSFPSELLYAIIEICSGPERCSLRATCKLLSEHADPIVFRRLGLFSRKDYPHITEHQIIALVTRSSKACEFTTDMEVVQVAGRICGGEQSLPHFGQCDDLKIHLPAALSTLRNMTRFRWLIYDDYTDWQINLLIQAVARLPQLTELDVVTGGLAHNARLPLGLFSHLVKLTVSSGQAGHDSFFVSEMATVIANSPQLKSLDVAYRGSRASRPTLTEFFAKTSTEHPLCLEHLSTCNVDITVDQVSLPHLAHLASLDFRFSSRNPSGTRDIWNSFLVNNIKLSDVVIDDIITRETISYLSSFSGLKRLTMRFNRINPDTTTENLKDMLFLGVLPKHAQSLQMLAIEGSYNEWVFDQFTSTSIMRCLNLRNLSVFIDGKESGMSVQRFLDTVAHLPALKIVRFCILDNLARAVGLANFKPNPGLRYVDEFAMDRKWYVLEKERNQPVRYREMK